MKSQDSPVGSASLVRIITSTLLCAAWTLTAPAVWAQSISLIQTGAVWKYLDTGMDLGTAWYAPDFNDAGWPAGPAQLGYGEMDEATLISFGPDPSNKYVTTYFRRSFVLTNANAVSNLLLRLLYDDGAVVYVNGVEALRVGMPDGPIAYDTLAATLVPDNLVHTASISPSLLINGTNLIAAEVHQANLTSSDPSFDLELRAAGLPVPPTPPVITRQPVSQTVFAGGTVTFTVEAIGTPPLTYQWLFNGNAIAGGTNLTLVLGNVQFGQAGSYAAVVANAAGTVMSAPATLVVRLAPDGPSMVVGWGDNRSGQINIPSGFSNVVALAGGELHSLALCRDGTVVSWGPGASAGGGRCAVPAGVTNVVAISAGAYHNLALKADGTVVEWAHNADYPTVQPPGLTNLVAIDAGGYHNLALTEDGTVVAWGANETGQSIVPPDLTNVIAIAAGHDYSLALRGDGKVVGWGHDYWSGHATCVDLPEAAALSAYFHAVALLADRTVVNWVSDYHFQSNVPPDLLNVQAIAAGGEHGLAIRDDWTVTAWASGNAYGATIVPSGLTGVTAVAGGDWHSLALVGEGSPFLTVQPLSRAANRGRMTIMYAWASGEAPLHYQWQFNGEDISGATNAMLVLRDLQPGDAGVYRAVVSNARGSVITRAATLAVVEVPPAITLEPMEQDKPLGAEARFRVVADGSGPLQYRWRFGDVDIPGATQPELVLTDLSLAQQGWYSAVVSNPFGAVTSAPVFLAVRQIVFWGGLTAEEREIPLDLTNAVAIAGGWVHGLALRVDGTLSAWGRNDCLQTDVPAGLSDVVAIDAGERHNLALRSDGTVVAWGAGMTNLGQGQWTDWGQSIVPPDLRNVVAVSAGGHVSLALKSDGTIAAWGEPTWGQTDVPREATNVIAIAAGGRHCLALKGDHTVVAWGDNEAGQASVPPNLKNVVAIAAGASASLALRADGRVVVWGHLHSDKNEPPPELANAVAIACGGKHATALAADGKVVAWGDDEFGANVAPAGLSKVVSIAGGGYFGLAMLGTTAPFITAQPASRNVVFGNDATLYVQVTGVWPLSYQWQRNGVNLPGATNAMLPLVHVQLSDSGDYRMTVSNSAGGVLSANATLTVLPPHTGPGSVDLNFDPGSGPGEVRVLSAVAVQSDGKIVLGGSFIRYDGAPRTGLARVNSDGGLDQSFAPQLGSRLFGGNACVNTLAVQSDGKIVVGGMFTSVNEVVHTSLARLRPDGSLDADFPAQLEYDPSRPEGAVTTIVLQPDGRILVSGIFDNLYFLRRLNLDGNWDDTFRPPRFRVSYECWLRALGVQSDGKIVVGEALEDTPWDGYLGLVRLHPDGSLDTRFAPRIRASGTLTQILIQPDDKIIILGKFTDSNHEPLPGVIRLNADGTLDPGFHSPVVDLGYWPTGALAPDGRLVLANGIQLEPDGTVNQRFQLDIAWSEPWSSGGMVAVESHGQVILSGYFTAVNGVARPGLVRLHGDLTPVAPVIAAHPASLTRYVGQNAAFSVNTVGTFPFTNLWQKDGAVVSDDERVRGAQTATLVISNVQPGDAGAYEFVVDNAGGRATSAIATLTVLPGPYGPGSPDVTFTPIIERVDLSWYHGPVQSIVLQSDGRILVAGDFANVNGELRTNLVRLLPDGTVDPGFQWNLPGFDWDRPWFNPSVLALQPDGKILVGGYGRDASGRFTGLLRLNADGRLDPSFEFAGTATDLPVPVRALALQPDGRILVSGTCPGMGPSGNRTNFLARLNADGSFDGTFQPLYVYDEDNYWARSILVQPDGKIVAAGYQFIAEEPWRALARFHADGTLDASFQANLEYCEGLLVQQPDGRLLVSGYFTDFSRRGVARLEADGRFDPSFHTFIVPDWGEWEDGSVSALALQPDGRILVGGMQWSWTPTPRQQVFVARLHADGSFDSEFQADLQCSNFTYAPISCIALQMDGQILIGGWFTEVGGLRQKYLARLESGGPIAPAIVTQPVDQARFTGQSARFRVVAEGTPPLTYQWFFNGAPLAGATNAELVLTNVQPEQAGNCWVVVTNAQGAVVSDNPSLSVLPLPTGPGAVDFSFDITGGGQRLGMAGSMAQDGYGSGVLVQAIAVQPDGRIIIGGDFVGVNRMPRANVARLLADGVTDPSFDSSWGADADVSDLAVQSDGRILLAGGFTRVQGVARLGLARLHGDGSVDAGFAPQIGVRGYYGAEFNVLWQPDGRILLRGAFTNVNGVPRPGLARLHADGSLDASFAPDGIVGGEGRYMSLMALQNDGRLLVAGSFGSNQTLLRLSADGSLDPTFHAELPDASHPLSVSALAIQQDGKILIGSHCETALFRLNPDGSLDRGFQRPNMVLGFVWKIVVQPDGRILAAADFGMVDGLTRRSLARFNADGSLDATFDPGLAAGPDRWSYDWPDVRALALLPNGQVLVGTRAEGDLANDYGFLRLDADGRRDTTFTPEMQPGHVSAKKIVLLPDGKVFVSGDFRVISGHESPWLARLNGDGTFDPTFALGPLAGLPLDFLARYEDGRMLFSARFTNGASGPFAVVRLGPEGAFDAAFASLSDNGCVAAAAFQPDGKIVLGGSFWIIDGIERRYLARLNADGTLDRSFVPAPLEIGDDWYITGVGVQRDGKIVVAGHIFDVPWENYYGLARLNPDGSLDTDFRARVRVNGPVFRLLIQPDDKILFGGSFSVVNGVRRPSLARLNADGSLDTSFAPLDAYFDGPPSFADTLALAPDSKIVVATDRQVLRLNPDGSVDATFQTEVGRGGWSGGLIEAVAVQADGRVYISGSFATVNGLLMSGLVRLQGDVAPVPPTLGTAPRSQTRFLGQPVTFTVDACGTLPLSFQWVFNGAPISGATNVTLTLSNVQPGHAGHYAVIVSNAAGAVTSPPATLTVWSILPGVGSPDVTFTPMIERSEPSCYPVCHGPVQSIVVQPDGRILVAGYFTNVNGELRTNLVRLLPDGTVDPGFQWNLPGFDWDRPGFNPSVLALQPDGKILMGGYGREASGRFTGLLRLNTDGSLDPSFEFAGTATDMPVPVRALALQPDGRILVSGTCPGMGPSGNRTNFLARLNADGSFDGTFQPLYIYDEDLWGVTSIGLQGDGKVVVAGLHVGLEWPLRTLARLNPDGSVDSGFHPNILGYVMTVLVQPNGQLLIAGSFSQVDDVAISGLARLNGDGSLDPSFQPPWSQPVGWWSSPAMVLQPDGRIVVDTGGHLLRLNADGSSDAEFAGGGLFLNGRVSTIGLQADGQILIGGWFTEVGGWPQKYLARLNGGPYRPAVLPPVRTEQGHVRITLTRLIPRTCFTLEATTNLVTWVPISTNTATSTVFDFVDVEAPQCRQRFYRAVCQP